MAHLHLGIQDQHGESFSPLDRVESAPAFLGQTDTQELGGIDYRFRTSIHWLELPAGKHAEHS